MLLEHLSTHLQLSAKHYMMKILAKGDVRAHKLKKKKKKKGKQSMHKTWTGRTVGFHGWEAARNTSQIGSFLCGHMMAHKPHWQLRCWGKWGAWQPQRGDTCSGCGEPDRLEGACLWSPLMCSGKCGNFPGASLVLLILCLSASTY